MISKLSVPFPKYSVIRCMMRPVFVAWFLLFSISSSFGRELFGVVRIDIEAIEVDRFVETGDKPISWKLGCVQEFYASSTDTQAVRVFQFPQNLKDIQHQTWDSVLDPWLTVGYPVRPFQEMYFRCTEIHNGRYKIIINESKSECVWIVKAKHVQYIRFPKFIKYAASYKNTWEPCGEIVITEQTKLYTRPDTASSQLTYHSDYCTIPVKVRGEWMLLTNYYNVYWCTNGLFIYPDETKDPDTRFEGWLRWRNRNKVLVELSVWRYR